MWIDPDETLVRLTTLLVWLECTYDDPDLDDDTREQARVDAYTVREIMDQVDRGDLAEVDSDS